MPHTQEGRQIGHLRVKFSKTSSRTLGRFWGRKMTFSRIVPDRFPGIPVAWGTPGEAPRGLWGPWGPTGGAPLGGPPLSLLGPLGPYVGPMWAHPAALWDPNSPLAGAALFMVVWLESAALVLPQRGIAIFRVCVCKR